MNKILLTALVVLSLSVPITSCHKPANETPTTSNAQILTDFSTNVSQAGYNDLAVKTAALYQAVLNFQANQTDANLAACQQAWYATRTVYELTEGFLFGPVVTLNIDPSLDTWPVNYVDIDSVINSNATLNVGYISTLSYPLIGFHPAEFILFGLHKNQTAAQITTRDMQFLVAVCAYMQTEGQQIASQWNPATSGNYSLQFTTAGSGSNIYPTQKAAFLDVVNAMSGICDEVANNKMYTPYIAKDSTLQESLYSNNSMADFKNNITGAQNAYIGKYGSVQGQSMQAFVKQYNLSLNDSINTEFTLALNALNGVTVTYGAAIYQQPTQLENAMAAINNLRATLNGSLVNLINQHITK